MSCAYAELIKLVAGCAMAATLESVIMQPITCLCFTYLQVDPSEVWLRSEQDSRAFFPDDSGHFNLHEAHLLFGAVLGVEGPNLPLSSTPHLTISSSAQSSGIGASASYNSNPPHLPYSSQWSQNTLGQRKQLWTSKLFEPRWKALAVEKLS